MVDFVEKEKLPVPTGGAATSSDIEENNVDGIDERSLLRKLDLRLLPAVGILYLLSFLDRSNGASHASTSLSRCCR